MANVSAKCKRLSAIWRTSPRTARGFLPFGKPLREMQEHFCHLANVSAKYKRLSAIWRNAPRTAEAFCRLANVSANCKSLSAVWRTSPRSARGFLPFGERLREVQEHFCRLANVSANCKRLSAIWRTSPRNARAKPTFLLHALRRASKDTLFSVNRAHMACYKAQKGATTGVAAPLHIPLWGRGTMSK